MSGGARRNEATWPGRERYNDRHALAHSPVHKAGHVPRAPKGETDTIVAIQGSCAVAHARHDAARKAVDMTPSSTQRPLHLPQ